MTYLVFISLLTSLLFKASSLSPSDITDNCLITFDSINTTFNLCNARIESIGPGQLSYYSTVDSRNVNNEDNSDGDRYEYFFNIAGPLSLIHPICEGMNFSGKPDIYGYCEDEDNCNALTPISDPVWAYQVWFNASTDEAFKCYRLSNEYGGPPQFNLYHDGDPSLGISVTYLNGDHDGCEKGNRKFNIIFVCADDILFFPDEYPLYEYSDCEYTIQVPSIYGCPTSCPEYDNQLCAGNGKCGFDWILNTPRCFCYNKWKGNDCSQPNAGDILSSDAFKIPPQPRSPFVKRFEDLEVDGALIDVTYDLNEFAVTSNVYVVTDIDFRHNHTYYVGIPDPIITGITPEFPAQCMNIIEPCDESDIVNGTCNSITFGTVQYAYIYQLDEETQQCLNLGTNVRWELYDQDNPARGVTGVYYDGSWCPQGGKNMELRIHLVCPTDQDAVFHPRNETRIDLFEYVEEDDDTLCSYSFTHYSAVACPYQCIGEEIYDNIETFTVCNQKGICVADPYAGFVRCLCDTGYTGIDCTELATDEPTTDPTEIPSSDPTAIPTNDPTGDPTENPSNQPTSIPSDDPTSVPSKEPTSNPSNEPTSSSPSKGPTSNPSKEPTSNPSNEPTNAVGAEGVTGSDDDEEGGFRILWVVLIVLCVFLVISISYVIYKNRKQKAQLERIDSVDINTDIDGGNTATAPLDGGNDAGNDTEERATLR